MTFLRSALFNALFFPVTALMAVLAVPLLAAPRAWLIGYVRAWAFWVIWVLRVVCGVRLRVTGEENLPRGPAIVAAKHQSAFDTVVWLVLLRQPVYVLKRELLAIPVWGWLARRCGHIAVDRRAGAAALRGLVRDGKRAVAEGRPIVIFPEGTRTAPGARVPYQPGVAALSVLDVPLVPVATDSGLRWGRRAFRKRAGMITVAVLPPLPAGLGRPALMARLEEAIEGESARLFREAVDKSGEE